MRDKVILDLLEFSEEPLPNVKGPKLDPFPHNGGHIEFLRLLGAGEHGYVFEVIIESHRYALKMFKFYNPIGHQQQLSILNLSDNDIIHQFDPFFAECRAFGRLKEYGMDGDAAVHCYGYIKLPPAFESIATRFRAVIWDRVSESRPFRGIVKELVSPEVPCFTSQMTIKMKADLLKLSKIGVFARDIRKENYRGGRLTDFSASWTWPHVMLSFKGRDAHAREVQEDLFDEMTQEMTPTSSTESKVFDRSVIE